MENTLNINWFPGHMAKAINEIKQKISLVDMVIEICDSRAVYASSNPIIKELIGNKYFLKVISKQDLADDIKSEHIIKDFESKGIPCVLTNLKDKKSIKDILLKINDVSKPMKEKDIRRGLKPRNVRVMVIGIPNVGKSTLINLIAKRNSAPVGNMPGFTKALKWVKTDNVDLLDTPGILWPDLKDNDVGIKLALIGCIKSDILPKHDLCKIALEYLYKNYEEVLYNRYGIKYENFDDFIDKFSIKKCHLLKDGVLDIDRSEDLILNELKNGIIGKISLEG